MIDTWQVPGGPGVRLDTHVVPGYRVPPNYDSMIAKLIVHAPTARPRSATGAGPREFEVGPIKTTIPLHRELMSTRASSKGGSTSTYLERLLKASAAARRG
jgi:acetyl-CoA carboxylase biotin carboxylase subunit